MPKQQKAYLRRGTERPKQQPFSANMQILPTHLMDTSILFDFWQKVEPSLALARRHRMGHMPCRVEHIVDLAFDHSYTDTPREPQIPADLQQTIRCNRADPPIDPL